MKVSEYYKSPLNMKPGARFKRTADSQTAMKFRGTYILANCDVNKLALIDLKSGERWTNPIGVNNLYSITQQEAQSIFGNLNEWEFVQ